MDTAKNTRVRTKHRVTLPFVIALQVAELALDRASPKLSGKTCTRLRKRYLVGSDKDRIGKHTNRR